MLSNNDVNLTNQAALMLSEILNLQSNVPLEIIVEKLKTKQWINTDLAIRDAAEPIIKSELLYADKNPNYPLRIIETLIEETLIDVSAPFGKNDDRTPLMWLMDGKLNISLAQKLIQYGANINTYNAKGESALTHAIAKGDLDGFKWYVEQNAPEALKQYTVAGWVEIATKYNQMEILEYVFSIEKYAPALKNEIGRFIESSCKHKHKAMTDWLITKTNQDSKYSFYAMQALGYACQNEWRDIMEILRGHIVAQNESIDDEPQINIFSKDFNCLISNANQYTTETIEWMQDTLNLSLQEVFMLNALSGHHSKVENLLKNKNREINATADNNRALKSAASSGHLKVINVLLEDQNVLDSLDINVLNFAVSSGRLNVVERLLREPKITAALKYDAYDTLKSARNHSTVLKRLLELDECRKDVTKYDNGVLENAASYGYTDAVKILLEIPEVLVLEANSQHCLSQANINGKPETARLIFDNPVLQAKQVKKAGVLLENAMRFDKGINLLLQNPEIFKWDVRHDSFSLRFAVESEYLFEKGINTLLSNKEYLKSALKNNRLQEAFLTAASSRKWSVVERIWRDLPQSLELAVRSGHLKLVKRLFEKKSFEPNQIIEALNHEINNKNKNHEIFKLLLTHFPLSYSTPDNIASLLLYVEHNEDQHYATLTTLLQPEITLTSSKFDIDSQLVARLWLERWNLNARRIPRIITREAWSEVLYHLNMTSDTPIKSAVTLLALHAHNLSQIKTLTNDNCTTESINESLVNFVNVIKPVFLKRFNDAGGVQAINKEIQQYALNQIVRFNPDFEKQIIKGDHQNLNDTKDVYQTLWRAYDKSEDGALTGSESNKEVIEMAAYYFLIAKESSELLNSLGITEHTHLPMLEFVNAIVNIQRGNSKKLDEDDVHNCRVMSCASLSGMGDWHPEINSNNIFRALLPGEIAKLFSEKLILCASEDDASQLFESLVMLNKQNAHNIINGTDDGLCESTIDGSYSDVLFKIRQDFMQELMSTDSVKNLINNYSANYASFAANAVDFGNTYYAEIRSTYEEYCKKTWGENNGDTLSPVTKQPFTPLRSSSLAESMDTGDDATIAEGSTPDLRKRKFKT